MELKKPSPRFFIASGCPIATTTLYRCVHLREQLLALGYEADVAEWFDDTRIDPDRALTYDIIVLYRLALSPSLETLIRSARKLGKPVIFDTDDLIFEPDLVKWHRGVSHLNANEQRLHVEGVRRYLATLQACDAVMTATPLLAELARKRGKPAFVHRNVLGTEMLTLADRLYERRRSRDTSGKVIIGYGSGTPTHDVDFQEASAALLEVMKRFHQVEVWIVGPLVLPSQFEALGEKVRRFPLTDWQQWFELMSRMDIALAPLEMNNIFCRAKSEIKFVESGSMGVPVVASAVDPYVDAMTNGKNGLLAATPADWAEALVSLIEHPEKRLEIGELARATILRRYSPRVGTADLASILPGLIGSSPDSAGVISGNRDQSDRRPAIPLIINWLVPEPFPGAGGDTGLFRVIRYLAEFGHECHVYVVPYNLMSDYSTEQIRAYVREHFGVTPAHYHKWSGSVGDADCTFATFWPTAENLATLPNGGRRYYLVQDFEPSFYPGDAHHISRAERTYRSGFHCITLGPWLTRLLRSQYHATADHFDFAVDTTIYRPRPVSREPNLRICFYARPSTPRRAYELGIEALGLVKTRRPEVEIVMFGSKELVPLPSFPFVNRGLVSQDQLASLFSGSDIGLVLSLTNPSFVPLEMMACRCAVVEVASERLDGVLAHGHDAWLVEPTATGISAGILRLIEDSKLRETMVENAYQRTQSMDWRQSVRQIEAILLRGVPEEERLRRGPDK